MADTSNNIDGLENQGPDALSYASAADFHPYNSPSHSSSSSSPYHHHQQQQQQHQEQHWTHDDQSNNNNHQTDITTSNYPQDNLAVDTDTLPQSNSSSSRSGSHTMDDNSIGRFEDLATPPPDSLSGMESPGHGRLGREGSADGGSMVSPVMTQDNSDHDNLLQSKSTTNANCKSTSSKHSNTNKDANNSSSAESTPRRSAPSNAGSPSSNSSRAKSANPPNSGRSGGGGGDRMVTSADMSMLDMKTSWDGSGMKGEEQQLVQKEGVEDDETVTTSSGGCGGSTFDGSVGECGNKTPAGSVTTGACGVNFTYTKLKYRAGMLADPAKIAKEREREERVRQARERLEEERKKKLDELREQQRLAQENRERQLEMRRQKIEDLRKRDTERRAAVEERRRMKEEIERLRKESILQKAEERVARYEAWRAGGRKGGRGQVLGFGSSAPRDVCLPFERPRRSSSQSALNNWHSPNGSDMDSMRPQRRAQSACSAVRRHCCVVDVNQMGNLPGFEGGTPRHLSMSTSVLYSKRHSDFSSSSTLSHANRPESTLALDTIREGRRSFVGRGGGGGPNSSPSASMSSSFHAGYTATPAGLQPSPVRMRERSTPRKPRPASVGTSMPSFVGGEPASKTLLSAASRSRSSDRMARDRSKSRPSRRKDKSVGSKESPTPAKKKEEKEKKEAEDEKDGGSGGTTKRGRVSLSFFDRLATPKFQKNQDDQKDSAKKESPIVRVYDADNSDNDDDDDDNDEKRNDDEIDAYMDDSAGSLFKLSSPRKAYSTTNLATIKKVTGPISELISTPVIREWDEKYIQAHTYEKSSFREKTTTTPKADSSTPRHITPRRDRSSPRTTGSSPAPTPSIMSKSMSAVSPRVTPPPPSSSSPHPTPTISVTSHGGTPTPLSNTEDGTASPRTAPSAGTNQDISKEAYKAKMAEKRRQAREKAEKEAEEERKRLEEERLAEEERMREEEEEQRRLEVETIRLAEEARKAEEERLQRAIEAEEKRKKEEAERLEQEKRAKEEADRKAKEEAERIEKEKQERAKKEEEERQQRKKKLEMIMKRVKTDPATQDKGADSPVKSSGSSPNRSGVASPEVQEMPPSFSTQENDNNSSSGSEDGNGKQNDAPSATGLSDNVDSSMISSEISSQPVVASNPVVRSASSGDIIDSAADEDKKEMEKGDSLGSLNTPNKPSTNGNGGSDSTPSSSSTEVKSRFKSPLLQQLVGDKGGSDSPSGSPKFKSPLLQNLLGKTKVGARMGLSASMGDLNLNKDSPSTAPPATTTTTTTSSTTPQQKEESLSPSSSLSPAGSSKEISKTGQDEDKDVDESVGSSASSTTSGNDHQQSFKAPMSPASSNDEDHLTNGKSSSTTASDVDDNDDNNGGRYDDASSPDSGSNVTKLSPSMGGVGMIDSALGSSIDPQQQGYGDGSSGLSNGHGGAKNSPDLMVDSSIGVETPEEDYRLLSTAPTGTSFNQFNYQSGQSSSQDETEEDEDDDEREKRIEGGGSDGRFEELIDLPYSTANSSSKTAVSPIIAFEENSLRAADVGESMS